LHAEQRVKRIGVTTKRSFRRAMCLLARPYSNCTAVPATAPTLKATALPLLRSTRACRISPLSQSAAVANSRLSTSRALSVLAQVSTRMDRKKCQCGAPFFSISKTIMRLPCANAFGICVSIWNPSSKSRAVESCAESVFVAKLFETKTRAIERTIQTERAGATQRADALFTVMSEARKNRSIDILPATAIFAWRAGPSASPFGPEQTL